MLHDNFVDKLYLFPFVVHSWRFWLTIAGADLVRGFWQYSCIGHLFNNIISVILTPWCATMGLSFQLSAFSWPSVSLQMARQALSSENSPLMHCSENSHFIGLLIVLVYLSHWCISYLCLSIRLADPSRYVLVNAPRWSISFIFSSKRLLDVPRSSFSFMLLVAKFLVSTSHWVTPLTDKNMLVVVLCLQNWARKFLTWFKMKMISLINASLSKASKDSVSTIGRKEKITSVNEVKPFNRWSTWSTVTSRKFKFVARWPLSENCLGVSVSLDHSTTSCSSPRWCLYFTTSCFAKPQVHSVSRGLLRPDSWVKQHSIRHYSVHWIRLNSGPGGAGLLSSMNEMPI